MNSVPVEGQAIVVLCPSCGSTCIDPAEHLPDQVPEQSEPIAATGASLAAEGQSVASSLTANLLYGLSLPERVVRGAIGLGAGAAREVAEFLVPQAFKDSASYKLAIENSLGFLTESIGGVPRKGGPVTADEAAAGETIARKAVGNFVDLAGLATLHVSPMWVLAVISDVAYGTATFTQELAEELQSQGVIDNAATIHHVDDILAAVQRTCGTAAGTFDRPPFSIDELRKTIDDTRQSLSAADLRRLMPEAELRSYWNEMRSIAQKEDVSLLGVSATVTMQTLNRVKSAGQSAIIGVQVAGGLLNRNILGHYRDSLTRVQQAGLLASVSESYGPYVSAVWDNFSSDRKSWTETLLDPATATGLFRKVSDRLWRRETPPE